MENKTELDLKDLFKILKKRIWLIITITIAATFTSAMVSIFLISPTYEAEVGIIIGAQQDGEKINNSEIDMYKNLMQTYKDIAETNKVAQAAADKLGDGQSSKDLIKRTTVTVKEGTMILNIKIRSNLAAEAYKDVQAYADAFNDRANTLLPGGNIKIMDDAQLPEYPIEPNIYRNMAIAFIAGLLVSVGITLLLDYMDDTLVTKEDAEKYLELSIIGIIPENNVE
ncbi:MAG: capsular biosynthesis protein [Bacillota bacterium]|nr:capsular biosynthesis protein [Bacillota bacterium]